ncbi:MAG: glucoamylase, partial [Ramlibacter sp.]|nr:glucoamylase [Ramlibacter sp.]
DTGAIVAAMTTSIPEAPGSGRNWDYRYCWLRDAFFVVRALNSISEVATMEEYLRWLMNVVIRSGGGHIQPLYGIGQEEQLPEKILDHLPGYRGMGPVRVGNQAQEHFQHDVYGNILLGAAQAFHDHRLRRRPSTTTGCSGAPRARSSRTWRRWANRLSASMTSPTPACGSCAPARASTRPRPS